MGPFFLTDLLGLDTVMHVAEHLQESYGDESFYVHEGLKALVEAGELGAKTGKGFYENGEPRSEGETDFDHDELTQRFVLKAFVESCLLLEDGMASIRDIDLGMMAGAGMLPPPFARADQAGLDEVLAALERAAGEWGEQFAPPLILRRLVAQGRLGAKTGQGFFAYKQPDEGFEQGEAVQLETCDGYAIAWLDRPPANSLSPQVVDELGAIWEHVEADDAIRALIIASANPMLFCAGADIKAFTKMDATSGAAFLDDVHALARRMELSSTVTIAAVNAVALGGGCELAMACDVRIAAQSASFGQPEVNLGIMPGFGGTQRLPRLVGTARALELNLTGDPISAQEAYEIGLVNRVVPDHELHDVARAWARKLGGQAPLAVAAIKRTTAGDADLDEGIEAEKKAFGEIFASADAREGIGAFLGKRAARWGGANSGVVGREPGQLLRIPGPRAVLMRRAAGGARPQRRLDPPEHRADDLDLRVVEPAAERGVGHAGHLLAALAQLLHASGQAADLRPGCELCDRCVQRDPQAQGCLPPALGIDVQAHAQRQLLTGQHGVASRQQRREALLGSQRRRARAAAIRPARAAIRSHYPSARPQPGRRRRTRFARRAPARGRPRARRDRRTRRGGPAVRG